MANSFWDLDLLFGFYILNSWAPTPLTGIFYSLTCAFAFLALHLDNHRTLPIVRISSSWTGLAFRRRCSWLTLWAIANTTDSFFWDIEGSSCSLHWFKKIYIYCSKDILPFSRSMRLLWIHSKEISKIAEDIISCLLIPKNFVQILHWKDFLIHHISFIHRLWVLLDHKLIFSCHLKVSHMHC